MTNMNPTLYEYLQVYNVSDYSRRHFFIQANTKISCKWGASPTITTCHQLNIEPHHILHVATERKRTYDQKVVSYVFISNPFLTPFFTSSFFACVSDSCHEQYSSQNALTGAKNASSDHTNCVNVSSNSGHDLYRSPNLQS